MIASLVCNGFCIAFCIVASQVFGNNLARDVRGVTFGRARGKTFKGVGEKVLVSRAERAS